MQSVPGTFPAGLGEPINAIITVNSDPTVLVDQEIEGGLRNYFLYVFHYLEQDDSRQQGGFAGLLDTRVNVLASILETIKPRI